MTDFEKEEFWKALGRLYDTSVALTRQAEAALAVTQSHEKRLDKVEVVVQWLAEEQRKRDHDAGKA